MKNSVFMRALRVWGRSYALAVLPPAVLWFILMTLSWDMNFGLLILLYSAGVHSVSYAVLGMPLFMVLVDMPDSPLWDRFPAVVAGGLIAACCSFVLFSLLNGSPDDGWQAAMVTSIYGAWTGFAASRAMRKLERKMKTIVLETFIAAPVERVFDVSRSIEVHAAGSAKTSARVVAGKASGLVELGDVVTWEAWHFGVKQRLTAKVVAYKHGEMFEDVMLKGAFASMQHTQLFREVTGGCVRRDVFRYAAPLWVFGWIAERLFLDKHMQSLLYDSVQMVKEYSESGS